MKLLSILIFSLLLVGCSGEQVADSITKTQIAMSGNKPPARYRIANLQTMNEYTFETKDFSFKLPTPKESDFSRMGGWWGASHRNGKTITSHLHPVYHMDISTSGNVLKHSERAKAAERKDRSYITHVRKKYNYPKDTKLYYGTFGQENYNCIVKERVDKFNRYKASYDCYKFNPEKTKSISVTTVLTYNKPKDPKLAKQYTYEDLKRRSKRTLDSLYIKDNW